MIRRPICVTLVLLLIFISLASAWSYSNAEPNGLGGPHRMINQIALKKFYALAEKDPFLSKYDFAPSAQKLGIKLDPKEHPFAVECKVVTKSGDWYKKDVGIPANLPWIPSFIEEEVQTHPFYWWVIEGGYSADEPESYMSLRHFYDPTGRAYDKKAEEYVNYLTDDLDPYISPLIMGRNPAMSAGRWAFNDSRYSIKVGYDAVYKAFCVAPVAEKGTLYGKAWRCLGETMHLLADMTVPAHVRNDSHPGALSRRWENIKNLQTDPYEEYVTAEEVADRADYMVYPVTQQKIDASKTAVELFTSIANFTNKSFFSTDTIPGTDKVTAEHVTNFNQQPKEYDSPKLENYDFVKSGDDGSGYYRPKGSTSANISVVRRDASGRHRIDRVCVFDQANALIPIAIAANIKLIDYFLPRVTVEIQSFDTKSKMIKCRSDAYVWDDKKNAYVKSSSPIFPGIEKKAVVFMTAGSHKKNYWLPIAGVNGGDFDVSGDAVIKDLTSIVKSDASVDSVSLGVAIDMGGILVKSDITKIQLTRPKPEEKPKVTEPKKPEPPAPKPETPEPAPKEQPVKFTIKSEMVEDYPSFGTVDYKLIIDGSGPWVKDRKYWVSWVHDGEEDGPYEARPGVNGSYFEVHWKKGTTHTVTARIGSAYSETNGSATVTVVAN